MEYLDNCPVCGKRLELKQINFTTAIYICIDLKCSYPVHGECMVVNRRIENINKTVDFLEAYKKEETLESSTNVSETTETFAERNLMLDLEELLNTQSDYNYSREASNEVQFQESEATDTFGSNFESKKPPLLELPELDDFLVDLFR